VVQVSTRLSNGEDESGFGFVVGERDNLLYVITANHMVRAGRPDIDTLAVRLRFSHDPWSRPVEAELLQARHRRLDLALLRVPIPDGLSLSWRVLHFCTRMERGEKAWFIGREQEWFVPTDAEAGAIHEPEPDLDGYIEFGISSVKPGSSGAPVMTRRGLIGMITDDDVTDARAVAVQFIRRFAREHRVPWALSDCRGAPAPSPTDYGELKPDTDLRNTLKDASQ